MDQTKLEPEFVRDLTTLIESGPYDWFVTFGFRSIAEQTELYEAYKRTGKNKAAPPGKSAHEFGLAVDLVLDTDPNKPGLQPSWDMKAKGWIWLIATVTKHPRLSSLAHIGDGGHVEKKSWKSYKGWQLNMARGPSLV